MADNNKIIIDIKVQGDGGVEVEKVTKSLDELRQSAQLTENSLTELISELKKSRAETNLDSKAYKELSDEIEFYNRLLAKGTSVTNINTRAKNRNAKSTNDMRDKTGLAGAAVVEVGRTISDSNYGITAMANNLSQLGTLFTTLVATTGGLANGIRALGAAFAGPLGIIVVFQVVIALIERFAMKSKEAASETKALTNAVSTQTRELENYIRQLNDANTSLAYRADILELLSKKDKNYAAILKQTEGNEKARTKALELYTRMLAEKDKLESASKAIGEALTENQEERAEANEKLAIALEKQTEAQKAYDEMLAKSEKEYPSGHIPRTSEMSNALFILTKALREAEDEYEDAEVVAQEFSAVINSGNVEMQANITTIQELERELKKLGIVLEEESDKTKKRSKETLDAFDISDDIRKIQENITLLLEEEEQKRIRIRADYHKQELELALFAYKEKAKLLVKQGDITKEQGDRMIQDAISQTKELLALVDLQTEGAVLKVLLKESDEEWKKFGKYLQTNINKLNTKVSEGELISYNGKGLFGVFFEELLGGNDATVEIASLFADSMSSIFDFADSEFQRSIDSTQAYYTKQNNILREQLNNEKLSAEERKRIQGEIAVNDEKSRKAQEETQKKQFKANKAFSIAEATVNTFLGATQALKTDGWLGIARAVATITFGLTQVAMIARQKYVPTASSMPSGGGAGGSGGGDRVFDFNLVGESPESQLNRTIQNQFDKPLQAYVVSKDISSQQELDLNIRNAAKI